MDLDRLCRKLDLIDNVGQELSKDDVLIIKEAIRHLHIYQELLYRGGSCWGFMEYLRTILEEYHKQPY